MACHVQCMRAQWKVKSGLAHTNAQIPLTYVYCTICAVAEQQNSPWVLTCRIPCPFTMTKVAANHPEQIITCADMNSHAHIHHTVLCALGVRNLGAIAFVVPARLRFFRSSVLWQPNCHKSRKDKSMRRSDCIFSISEARGKKDFL